MALFTELAANVAKLTSASESMKAVLIDVKAKLDAVLAKSNLTAEDTAELKSLSDALGTEADIIVEATVANTPAA